MAPFRGGSGLVGALFPVVNFLDVITFGLCGKLLDGISRKDKPSSPDDPTPRTAGTWGQALAMYRVGSQIDGVKPPLQLITTEGDPMSGKGPARAILQGSGDDSSDGWFHFTAEEKVKHAMLSRLENPNGASVDTIEAIVSDFVGKGQPSDRAPA